MPKPALNKQDKLRKNRLIKEYGNKKNGFTLVELLVVMAIIGVLVTLVGMSFRSSQLRSRDVQRKSDLKQIQSALELFFSDYGKYPESDAQGRIKACPFTKEVGFEDGIACMWGEGLLSDGKTTYLLKIPQDTVSSHSYLYQIVPDSNNQKYQLFARLENPEDINCLSGDCASSPVSYLCGSSASLVCNFALTSPNTNALE